VKADFGASAPVPTSEELVEIAAGIRHRLASEGGANPADAGQWLRVKQGWSAAMTGAHTVDHALEWFELFTATWGDFVEGTIIGGPASRGPRVTNSEPQLSAYVAYTTGDLTTVASDDRDALWFVDDTITRHVAEQAVAWAYTRGAGQWLARSAWWWVEPVDPTGVGPVLGTAMDDYVSSQYLCVHPDPYRARMAGFRPQGTAFFQVTDPTLDWATRLDLVRRTLSWTPPHTDLAFVRYGYGGQALWSHPTVPWPHVNESNVRYTRPLLASFVPDANGLQLLTDAHLDRATDLSGWDIEPLAAGRHLVTSRDLDAWYATPEPDPDVLARARADFGQMILTPDLIEAHTPWTDGPYSAENLRLRRLSQ
jgi:hypothetical protein